MSAGDLRVLQNARRSWTRPPRRSCRRPAARSDRRGDSWWRCRAARRPALYALLATPPYAARVDWSRVHVFFGDERCVPPDDPASNYRMAREHLLDRVPVPASQIHRLRGEDDPTAAAAAYERELRRELATPEGPPRTAPGARFDVVLLGLGPGSPALRFVGAARESYWSFTRVTDTDIPTETERF